MSVTNVDATTVMGISAGGPQATLTEKVSAYPEERTLTYGSIPPEATWGQIVRISVPASTTVKPDSFPCWRRVMLKFSSGLRTMPANVTGVKMSPMNLLHQADKIALYFDNVLVHEVTNGAQGSICQKYLDAVLARSSPDLERGWSTTQYLFDLCRDSTILRGNPAFFNSYDGISAIGTSAMLLDRGIDLSLLFDDLLTNFDCRCAGRMMRVEVTLRDMPPTIGTQLGNLLCFSTIGGDGTDDPRACFGWDNIRLEIETQNFPKDPFMNRKEYVHTFLTWSTASLPVNLSIPGTVHRWMLGQTHRGLHAIRRLLMWIHCMAMPNNGTHYNMETDIFFCTHNNFLGGRNSLELCTYKLAQNGIDILDPQTDYCRKHANSVEMQKTCYGGVMLHPLNDGNGDADWDYPVAGSVLLCHPGHPHKENYDTTEVHSMIPYGLSNTNVSEYEFSYTANFELAAGNVWRGEMQVVLEAYKIVKFTPNYKTGQVAIHNVLN